VILAIGTSLTRHNISTPIIPPGKTIIHATNDPRDLHKANDTALGILGDAKLVLAQLIEGGEGRIRQSEDQGRAPPHRRIEGGVAGRAGKASCARPRKPICPYFVMSEFMRVIPSEDAIVTHDSGSPRDQLCRSTSRKSRAATWAGASRTSSAPGWAWRSAPRSARPTRCA
jgi:acetolactate synthase-1/2/3 large subunit